MTEAGDDIVATLMLACRLCASAFARERPAVDPPKPSAEAGALHAPSSLSSPRAPLA
jgi:hypothetical protein